MTTPSPLREQLLATTAAFMRAMNEFTPESVVQHRRADCTQRVLPASLGVTPLRGCAAYADFMRGFMPMMRGFAVEYVAGAGAAGGPIVDEVARKTVLHLRSRADTDLGPYANEYILVLSMSEDGTELVDVMEFADSLYSREFWGRRPRDPKAKA